MNMDLDVCDVLPSIRVPTLVMNRTGDSPRSVRTGHYVADHIPGARLVQLPGADIAPALGDSDTVLAELDAFLGEVAEGKQWEVEPDRVLATVLFTDLVESTARAVELGPRWQDALREHNAAIRRELTRFRGREIDTAGDGFFASGFDGPARAIRCGCAISDAISGLGLGIRVGLHTGECEIVDDKLSGLTVNIGARVAAQAEEGEVVVSGTVKDLVAGSGITFESRGMRDLKGLGEWPVYAVVRPDRHARDGA
jgi:class 3 adenylate cyclase